LRQTRRTCKKQGQQKISKKDATFSWIFWTELEASQCRISDNANKINVKTKRRA